jgi:hypothetical protein
MLKTVSTQLALASDTLSEILANDNTSGANNIVMTSGYGIDFSATAGTGTSELFNDYEEGTWTPVLQFGGASVGITYVAGYQNGLYTKVGNLVTLTGVIYPSSKGSSTGAATISGLPFYSANTDGAQSAATSRIYSISFADVPSISINSNGTVLIFSEVTNAGASTTLTDANFIDYSYAHFCITYRVA